MSSAPDGGRGLRVGRAVLALAALTACNSEPAAAPDPLVGSAHGTPTAAPPPAAPTPSPATPPPSPPPRAPDPPAPAPSVIVMDEPKLALPKQESFKLLDAGARPRTPLRYALAGATTFTTETTLSSRQAQDGAFGAPVALPLVRDGFAITVVDRTKLALQPLPAEAASSSREADIFLGPWRTLLQGRHIALLFDDRGAFSKIAFADDPTSARSATAKDELIQRLLTVIVPLPAEPVGTGARWRVVTILRQRLPYVKQTATYTLVSRTPTRWKLHVALQRVGEEQRIDDPALPAGTTAELVALFRLLEGDVEIDPTHPLVAAGTLTIESRMHARLKPPNQPAAERLIEDTGSVTFALRDGK